MINEVVLFDRSHYSVDPEFSYFLLSLLSPEECNLQKLVCRILVGFNCNLVEE